MFERSSTYKIYKKIYFLLVWLFYKLFTNVKIGKNVKIEASATIYGNVILGDNVFIGKDVFISGNITIGDNTSIQNFSKITTMKNSFISIGKNCLIGQFNILGSCNHLLVEDDVLFAAGVKLFNGNHGLIEMIYEERIKDTPLYGEKMTIGKNSWLGFDVHIIKGAQIGNNCIIGANSVVNSKIEQNTIAAGTPARIIKKRDFKKDFEFKMKQNKLIEASLNLDNIIIYGAGTILESSLSAIKDKIIAIVDIDSMKIGTYTQNIIIIHPDKLSSLNYNKILISVLGRENEIASYLINNFKIPTEKIMKLKIDYEGFK